MKKMKVSFLLIFYLERSAHNNSLARSKFFLQFVFVREQRQRLGTAWSGASLTQFFK